MSRSQEHEIEIGAPVEDVWHALVDPERLTRWFVEEARVEPGPGGRVWASWGEGMDIETQIEVWEPPTRLQLLGTFGGALEEPMVEEYVLETRGGATVLRFVHGGSPTRRTGTACTRARSGAGGSSSATSATPSSSTRASRGRAATR